MKQILESKTFWMFVLAQVIAALGIFGVSDFHMSERLVQYLIGVIDGLGTVLFGGAALIAYRKAKAVK